MPTCARNASRDPVRIAMDKAISETASRLRDTLDRHGPDALSFYVSGQMSLEAQYLINKLAKGFVGTNNIESNSRLCMASAGSGYKLSLGSDGPPGSYQDFDQADLFFVIGANMADCHPILFLRMMDRVKAGAKLIVVDPRRSATADKAGLFLPIKPGTDLALLNGLLHLLVKNGHTDPAFIAAFTEGWDAMPEFLEDYPPATVAHITGLPEADIRQAAQWIGEAAEWMSCWTMGLNQSTHGTWNTNALCNLHLATGAICRPGSGPFSLTGQPNAMGGREMGYMGPGLPGQRSVLVEADRTFIEDLWSIPRDSLPRNVGGGTVAMFEDMSAGKIKACWIICTNPVASGAQPPESDRRPAGGRTGHHPGRLPRHRDQPLRRHPAARRALGRGRGRDDQLRAQPDADAKSRGAPGRDAARLADHRPGGLRDGLRRRRSPTALPTKCSKRSSAPGTPRPATTFAAPATRACATNRCNGPARPRPRLERNPIRYLNNGVSQTLKVEADGSQPAIVFATERGKGIFLARPHMAPAEMPDEAFPFVLNTGRLQHQWHTLTKTGKVATLNKLNPGPFVEIHPEDASALGHQGQGPGRSTLRARSGRVAGGGDRPRAPGQLFCAFSLERCVWREPGDQCRDQRCRRPDIAAA